MSAVHRALLASIVGAAFAVIAAGACTSNTPWYESLATKDAAAPPLPIVPRDASGPTPDGGVVCPSAETCTRLCAAGDAGAGFCAGVACIEYACTACCAGGYFTWCNEIERGRWGCSNSPGYAGSSPCSNFGGIAGGSACGTRAPEGTAGVTCAGAITEPYLCHGICGSPNYVCYGRADCCSDDCGAHTSKPTACRCSGDYVPQLCTTSADCENCSIRAPCNGGVCCFAHGAPCERSETTGINTCCDPADACVNGTCTAQCGLAGDSCTSKSDCCNVGGRAESCVLGKCCSAKGGPPPCCPGYTTDSAGMCSVPCRPLGQYCGAGPPPCCDGAQCTNGYCCDSSGTCCGKAGGLRPCCPGLSPDAQGICH